MSNPIEDRLVSVSKLIGQSNDASRPKDTLGPIRARDLDRFLRVAVKIRERREATKLDLDKMAEEWQR